MSRDELIEADSVPSLQPIFTNHLDPLNSDMKFPKTDSECCPLISIITVVFNGESYIEKTILSVLNQTYKNIEYIIVDGGSQDNTLNIISKYKPYLSHLISEPDDGIYDAMNKGISLAKGKWINFMNGGDSFYNEKTLEDIFALESYWHSAIIYGSHQVVYPSGKKKIRLPGKLEDIWKGSRFCHQSVFVLANFQKTNKFNKSNKISADFEFFYTAYQSGVLFQKIDLVVSSVASGGLSDTNRVDTILGFWTTVDRSKRANLFYALVMLLELLKSEVKLLLRRSIFFRP